MAAGLCAIAEMADPAARVSTKGGLLYVWIAPGRFVMGCSPGDDSCFEWEKPARAIIVHKGFWIGQTEVTQESYQRVMGSNPSRYKGARRPVDQVSWYNARKYCQTVGMRLPTEAEWEDSARGGASSARYGPLDDIAWNDGNGGDVTHQFGQKLPNAFGLYDTLGNVWEWVEDRYSPDPSKRVLRGDSFYNLPDHVRVSDRLWRCPRPLIAIWA